MSPLHKVYNCQHIAGNMGKSISDIEKEYDLDLGGIEREIEKGKPMRVLLQFPDGLKPYAPAVVEKLETRIKNVEFFIWLGSCYGACDVPEVSEKEFDLIVQFGHSRWKFKGN